MRFSVKNEKNLLIQTFYGDVVVNCLYFQVQWLLSFYFGKRQNKYFALLFFHLANLIVYRNYYYYVI